MIQFTKIYDLEERTAKFGGEIIKFCKNIQETKHWLRMLGVFDSNLKDKTLPLWQEAQSLTMIFQKITNSLNKRV